VIAIYPLLLVWAAVLIRRRKQEPRPGWAGFTVWTAAGAVFTFSLLTGLSIGLLLLPFVVAALYLAARSAPDFRASIGFVAGIGVVPADGLDPQLLGWLAHPRSRPRHRRAGVVQRRPTDESTPAAVSEVAGLLELIHRTRDRAGAAR
jgi:hypothetical protein